MFQCKDLSGILAYPKDAKAPCMILWDDDCGGYRKVADEEKGDCECTLISFGETTVSKKSAPTALPLLRQQLRRAFEQACL